MKAPAGAFVVHTHQLIRPEKLNPDQLQRYLYHRHDVIRRETTITYRQTLSIAHNYTDRETPFIINGLAIAGNSYSYMLVDPEQVLSIIIFTHDLTHNIKWRSGVYFTCTYLPRPTRNLT